MAVVDPTTNYSWNLPTDLGDDGAWGAMLRTIFGDDTTGLDTILKAVSDVADAALPKAGGTMTGLLTVFTEKFTITNLGNITGATAINLATADTFYGTVTGNPTFSFSNVPATGAAVFVTLELTNAGAYTITWPASVTWPGGSPPDLTASGVDVLTFYTRDGGTTWRAAASMLDLS